MERLAVSVAEGYALWAPVYDASPNGLIWLEQPIVRRMLGDVRGLDVLDSGCGTGRHTIWLHEQGARVVGADASEEMLAVARSKCPELPLVRAALDALPFQAASFDVALNALVLEHVADLTAAIGALARVLRPGARLVVSVFHPFFLFKGVRPHFEHPGHGVEYELPSHVHLVADYLRALRAHHLDLDELEEPRVDDALIAALPRFDKHRGHPLAIVLSATKQH